MSQLEEFCKKLREDAVQCDTSFCGVEPHDPCPRCCRVKAAAEMLEHVDEVCTSTMRDGSDVDTVTFADLLIDRVELLAEEAMSKKPEPRQSSQKGGG